MKKIAILVFLLCGVAFGAENLGVNQAQIHTFKSNQNDGIAIKVQGLDDKNITPIVFEIIINGKSRIKQSAVFGAFGQGIDVHTNKCYANRMFITSKEPIAKKCRITLDIADKLWGRCKDGDSFVAIQKYNIIDKGNREQNLVIIFDKSNDECQKIFNAKTMKTLENTLFLNTKNSRTNK